MKIWKDVSYNLEEGNNIHFSHCFDNMLGKTFGKPQISVVLKQKKTA